MRLPRPERLLASLSPSFVALVGLFPGESCSHGTTGEPEAFALVHPQVAGARTLEHAACSPEGSWGAPSKPKSAKIPVFNGPRLCARRAEEVKVFL